MQKAVGPILAIDLGEKRIGVALSDALGIAARPLEVFKRTSRKADFAHIAALARTHEVALVLFGLPTSLDGSEGRMAAWVRDYAQDFSQKQAISIAFWDESFTSEAAAEIMAAQGYSRKQMRGKLDGVAAALILQSYLEKLREEARSEGEA